MKRLIPDTIAGRTLLVLVLGLTLSHAASMAMYFVDRSSALVLAGEEHVGERIATIVDLVERTPPTEQPRLIERASGPSLRVTLSNESAVAADQARTWQSSVLREGLVAHLSGPDERDVRIRYLDPTTAKTEGVVVSWPDKERAPEKIIVASLDVPGAGWLNFVAPIATPESIWSVKFVLSTAVMVVAIVVLSAIVVHHLVAPLQAFGRAAERLGTDVHAPALPETGPKEVQQATQAFNEMHSRIRRFVDDRTRMLAAISHDLRTPITRLHLRAEFIEDEEQRDKMLHDLDEMESMIASILSFAREDTSDEPQEVIDLAALVGSICDDMADLGHDVSFTGVERLPYACRRQALRRALSNLVENAVRYGERALVDLSEVDGQIAIRIEDDGPGIPEAEQEKAFDAFYRVERSRSRRTGGTGLGLYVARAVVRGHGGDIRLSNRPEGGLRAEVTLPRRRT
jgi:signal transduction histidine kinase